MARVRTEALNRAYSKISNDGKNIHISGEPGIGKSEFLQHLVDDLSDEFNVLQKGVRVHHTTEKLERDLLHLVRSAAPERHAKRSELVSVSGGVAGISGGGTVDDRVRDIYKLGDLTSNWSEEPLVLCIDDIHKIDEDEKVVRDVIGEISSVLSDDVHLVTVGQISGIQDKKVEEIHLNLFTLAETEVFLEEEFGQLEEETVSSVHSAVDGHPLYLSLLTESTDDDEDLVLPEDEVFDSIEENYIDGLSSEEYRFLRQVAPLPELDEKTCSGVTEDWSSVEIDRLLRGLNRRTIVQEVNRTDEGHKIYKIHEVFRDLLIRKHRNEKEVCRQALHHHLEEISYHVTEGGEDSLLESLPHSFYVKHYLGAIYGEDAGADELLEEINQIDLEYPHRGFIVVYSGFSVLPKDVVDLWQQELPYFQDWVFENTENEIQAELVCRIMEWGLSQFGDEDPMELSDINVDGSLDDLPESEQPVQDMDLSDQHAKRMRTAWINILSFFLTEEPYRSKTHREQVGKTFETYGISEELIFEFRDRCKSTLSDSDLGDEFEDFLEGFVTLMGEEFEGSTKSSIDFYEVRDLAMEMGREMFDDFHYQVLLNSGVLANVAEEGGEVLEKAENPVFAMFWYSLFTVYFRNTTPDSEDFTRVKELYLEQLEKRREYEEQVDDPIIRAKDSAESLALEEAEMD